jgi:hypothetical protein
MTMSRQVHSVLFIAFISMLVSMPAFAQEFGRGLTRWGVNTFLIPLGIISMIITAVGAIVGNQQMLKPAFFTLIITAALTLVEREWTQIASLIGK